MRLSTEQRQQIRQTATEVFKQPVEVLLFGSRVDDRRRGGDVDLLVRLSAPEPEATWKAARLSARLSRLFQGRKVDVLVQGPSLRRLPIHEVAEQTGERV